MEAYTYINDDLAGFMPGPDLVRPHKQRSSAWYEARRGRFTGSEVWKLMVEPREAAAKKLGMPSQTTLQYIREKLAEKITGISPDFYAPAIQWGLDYEDDGKKAYTRLTGKAVADCDFVAFGEYGGGSPDGLIGEDGLLELKCPYNSGVHLDNLILASKKPNEEFFKEYHRDYYWQIQNNLHVTGRKWAHFVSYDPRFPSHQQICVITVMYVAIDGQELMKKVEHASKVMNEMSEDLQAA